MGMDRLSKLLAITLTVLIIIAGFEAYIIQTKPTNSVSSPVRIACVGDSLTRGTEYTLFLWDHLGSTNYLLSDFGVGGTTVSMASEKPYRNQSAYTLAQYFQPNIVIIMLGTNDASDGANKDTASFVADYKTLIAPFQALPTKPSIYLVMPPPIYNSTGLSNAVLNRRVLPGIQTVASQTGATLIDANTPLLNKADLFTDGVHPDADGAKIIADTIYAKLALP
jgi:lysophospholipase L1-like esterase